MKIPQMQENSEKAGRAVSIVTALLLFLCIVSVAFYTWQKSLNPSATVKDLLKLVQYKVSDDPQDAQVQYSFNYDSALKPVFMVYRDLLIKCDSGGIWSLDKKGGIVWSESLPYGNPLLKTNGSQLLVADVGSNGISVIQDQTVQWSDKIDSTILNADISEDGYVTVITSSKRDNNEIRVYDPYGNELFRRIIANDYAVSAGVFPSDKVLAVSGISVGAVGAYSSYKFYDFNGKDLGAQVFETSGEMLPLFWYNKDGSLFAAGDRSIASMDKMGTILWEKQYRSVAGASPAGNNRFAVAAETEEGAELILYSKEGKVLSTCAFQGKARGLTAIRGAIAVNTLDSVYFYNDKCKNTYKYAADSNIRQVFLFSRQQAAVIMDGRVEVIHIG